MKYDARKTTGYAPSSVRSRLSAQAINDVVKARAKMAGLSDRDISAHSLRSGFATQASKGGAALHELMAQTRHSKAETAIGYIRDAELFGSRNASRRLGL